MHSRQGSIDQSSLQDKSRQLNQQHILLQQKLNNLSSNFHSRSASEPVSVMPPVNKQHTQFPIGSQNQPPVQSSAYIQQNSMPHGWQPAMTQNEQQYYVK